jgi:hypothetical protein
LRKRITEDKLDGDFFLYIISCSTYINNIAKCFFLSNLLLAGGARQFGGEFWKRFWNIQKITETKKKILKIARKRQNRDCSSAKISTFCNIFPPN